MTACPFPLVILQHPKEALADLNTARLATLTLRGSIHCIGLSWPSLSSIVKTQVDPKTWAVLYLGAQKEKNSNSTLFHQEEKLFELYRTRAQKSNSKEPKSEMPKIQGLVVIDGSWKQVKSVWWRNPWLAKLQRLKLSPQSPSALKLLRKSPRAEMLSTAEAIAFALMGLAKNSPGPSVVLENFDKWIFLKNTVKPGSLPQTLNELR